MPGDRRWPGKLRPGIRNRCHFFLKPDGNGCDVVMALESGTDQAMGIFFFLTADYLFQPGVI